MSKLNIDKTLGVGGIMSVALAAVLGLSDAGTHRIGFERKGEIYGGACQDETSDGAVGCKKVEKPGDSLCTGNASWSYDKSGNPISQLTYANGQSVVECAKENGSIPGPVGGNTWTDTCEKTSAQCDDGPKWVCKYSIGGGGYFEQVGMESCGERDGCNHTGRQEKSSKCATPTPTKPTS
jgi:hypothetical protein